VVDHYLPLIARIIEPVHIAAVDLVARRKLGGDLSRRHRAIGVSRSISRIARLHWPRGMNVGFLRRRIGRIL
jgi:hypothetical protein